MIFRPLEKLHLCVIAILLTLCLASGAAGRLQGWGWLAAEYTLMGLGLLWVGRMVRRLVDGAAMPAPLAALIDIYPALYVPLVFNSLGQLIPALNAGADPGRDAWLIAADRLLLGVDPTVWLERFVTPWLTNVMYLLYYLYFVLPVAVTIALWRWQGLRALRRFVFVIALSFFISYIGYFVVPAKGPRFAMEAMQTIKLHELQATAFSRALADGMNFVERNKNDVFPSGHVMMTIVCLLYSRRVGNGLFFALLPVAVGVLISTVYCRYHYVIDVAVGLLLALPMPSFGAWLYARIGGEIAPIMPANVAAAMARGEYTGRWRDPTLGEQS